VAPRGKKKATSADAWLIEGAETARPEAAEEAASDDDFAAVAPPPKVEPADANAGAGTKQWLAVPELANGAGATEVRKAHPDESQELADALTERDALRKRVEGLESELAATKKRVASERSGSQPEAKPKTEAPARPTATRKKTKNGKLDLNSATFEELRDLGLTVTLSARLIAYRDVRGGYESLDELNGIPGFSKETLGAIREQLKLED
jgi:DNA uptake protein ComE-like DNA-binding protein